MVLALAAAARQHGATIATGSPVHAVIREGNRISGVRSGDDVVNTQTVVLATGCWSGLFGELLGIRIPIGDATLIRAWAGLRPHAPDELPLIGPHPAVNGLILATGHFRGGILFGAITGRLVQEIITGTTPSIPLDPFRPDRQQHSFPEN